MVYVLLTILKGMLNLLYFPMKLRKCEDKIVFMSRQSDMVSIDMYLLSKELKRCAPSIEQVFRVRAMKDGWYGKLVYCICLLGDMWQMANAKAVICDTYLIPVSCLKHKKQLYIIQIWHALGAIKKFGLQSLGKEEGRDIKVSKALNMHKGYDCVLAPSEATREFYSEAFGIDKSKIKIYSLPRVDYILRIQEQVKKSFLHLNPVFVNKKIVLYLPTFREGEEEIVERIREVFENEVGLELIISLHPLSKVRSRVQEEYQGTYNSYELMKLADVIITDYSAAAFEGALLDKPLYFYIPDYLTYDHNRGLNIKLPQEVPGLVYMKPEKLVAALKEEKYNYELLRNFKEKYVENVESCTDKIVEYILTKMK